MKVHQITTLHPASAHGLPVALDAGGNVIPSGEACRQIRQHFTWPAKRMASECGVSLRTVQGWEMGRPVPAAAMNVFADLIR